MLPIWAHACGHIFPVPLQLTCIAGASDLGNTSQTIRVECGGDINPGTVAEARFDWSSILLNSTRLEDTMLMVDSIPDTLREVCSGMFALNSTAHGRFHWKWR